MRKARQYWESKGGLVYQVVHGRYGHKDIFGLFDQLVLLNGELLFVQVKTNKQDSITKHLAFRDGMRFPARIVLMTWIDRKGFMVKDL